MVSFSNLTDILRYARGYLSESILKAGQRYVLDTVTILVSTNDQEQSRSKCLLKGSSAARVP